MPEIKVHLGCGKRCLPGYIHIDLATYPHIDHQHDIRTLPMLGDDTVDLIHASHVLEYFDRVEVLAVLAEWKRVLKPGGRLRLAVPDFAALAQVYLKYQNLGMIVGPLYGKWQIPGTEQTVYHKTVYDFSALKDVLVDAGFQNVQLWDWRQVFTGELADFDDYSQAYVPHLAKETGILISLNVEAQK